MKRECILDIVLLLLTHVLVRVFSTKRKRRKGKNREKERERDYYTTIKKIFVCVRVVILFACVYYIKFILVMTI